MRSTGAGGCGGRLARAVAHQRRTGPGIRSAAASEPVALRGMDPGSPPAPPVAAPASALSRRARYRPGRQDPHQPPACWQTSTRSTAVVSRRPQPTRPRVCVAAARLRAARNTTQLVVLITQHNGVSHQRDLTPGPRWGTAVPPPSQCIRIAGVNRASPASVGDSGCHQAVRDACRQAACIYI